ncbi:orexin receptor type 2-like [Diadema antillarum]|uniref:orexin receptor type 2-like n=1 Tax=Diadema antillarum TaxID=105358 RepID=UPI003A87D580
MAEESSEVVNAAYGASHELWNHTIVYDDDYIYDMFLRARRRVYPEFHEYFLIAFYVAILILALLGNTMVCVAILKNDHMRTVTNYYILNLAVTDILIAICLPTTITTDITDTWFFGKIACHFIPYFQVVLLCASIYTLMMIAVDRYLAICHPLKFQIRASRTALTIALVWVVSFLVPLPKAVVQRTLPNVLGPHIGKPTWLTECDEILWPQGVWEKMYHTAFFVVGYLLPLTVIGVAYIRVCRRLWSGIPTEEGCGATKPDLQNNVMTTKTISKSTEAQLKSRRKVASMLIVVVVTFAVCFFPFQLLNLLKRHEAFSSLDGSVDFNFVHVPYIIAHFMAFVNSAINPIIYNFMSAKFRQAFKSMFDCLPYCKAPESDAQRSRPGPPYRRANSTGVSDTHTTEYVPMTSIRNSKNNNSSFSVVAK